MAACLLLPLNTALARHGLPSLASSGAAGRYPLGDDAVRVLSAVGLSLAVIGLSSRRITALQWLMILTAGLWIATPALSAMAAGAATPWSHFGMSAIAVGVAVSASLAGARQTRWLIFIMTAAWAGASLATGIYAASSSTGAPSTVLLSDPIDRYTQWLRAIGLSVEDGSVRALVGLSQHRQLLGMLLALALAVQVRHLFTVARSWWRVLGLALLGPGVTVLALAWTLSRTGLAAAAVGLALSLLPWERLGQALGSAAIAAVAFALPLIPLVFDGRIMEQVGASGTVAWRVIVWRTYLADGQLWTLWGIGPLQDVPLGAAHAHNEPLQTLVLGGWAGLAALVVFVALASWAGIRAARMDRRTAIAALLTAATVAQFEVISPTNVHRELNPALIIFLAVTVSAAGLGGMFDRTRDASPTTADESASADSEGPSEAISTPTLVAEDVDR